MSFNYKVKMTVVSYITGKNTIKLQLDVELFMITISIASDQCFTKKVGLFFKKIISFFLLLFTVFSYTGLTRAPSFSVSNLLF